jgi:diadenosine tetraphosphate (Ap4A) HIT family hydrolase
LESEDAQRRFREKFRLDELTVHEGDDWTLSVRPAQPVLGALVLATRHTALSFAQLRAESGAEMLRLTAGAEEAARAMFGCVRLNALCLMMQDPLFHLHLLPRYGEPVEFAGRTWRDAGWPGPPDLADNQAGDDRELPALVRAYADGEWFA